LLAIASNPTAVFAERDALLDEARHGGTRGLAALKVLAGLCAHGANYRGKLLPPLARLLAAVAADQLPRYLAAVSPAVRDSDEAVKRIEREVEPRLTALDAPLRDKIQQQLGKLGARAPRGRSGR